MWELAARPALAAAPAIAIAIYFSTMLSNSQGLPASLDHEVLRQLPCRLLGSWCQFRTSMRILGRMQVSKCEFPSMTLPLQCSPKVSERVSARTSKGFLAPLPPQPRLVETSCSEIWIGWPLAVATGMHKLRKADLRLCHLLRGGREVKSHLRSPSDFLCTFGAF